MSLDRNRLVLFHLAEPNGRLNDQLAAREAALLKECDGERTVEQLTRDMVNQRAAGFQSDQEVLAQLDSLRDKGLISLTLAVPVELRPELTLRRLLGRIGDTNLRDHCLGALDRLQQARDRVASSDREQRWSP